jgi:hypothetical protein
MSADGPLTLDMKKARSSREALLDVKGRARGLNPLTCGCKLAFMEQPPSLEKEISTRTGRRLWGVTLGIAGLLILIGLIFLFIGQHIGLPHH